MPPAATVVIPTFERPDHLHAALESVAAQDYEGNTKAIIVDGSKEATAEEVVREFSFAEYLWQFDHVPNQETKISNIAVARDLAVSFAESEYIHFLDDDDTLTPSAISKKIQAVQNNPLAKGAYSAVERADGVVKNVPEAVVGSELRFTLTNLRPPTLPSALLIHRDILLDCPPLRTLPHPDICGLIEILLRTHLVYIDEGLTVREDEPTTAQTVASQEGRLETYDRYTGLRLRLLQPQLQQEAVSNYERIQQNLQQLKK